LLPADRLTVDEKGGIEIRLIVNADDFGLTPGVNVGIIEAHEKGILTSATLMATAPFFQHAVDLAREHPGLGVGLHLNLASGRPVSSGSDVEALLEHGAPPGLSRLLMKAWLPSLQKPIRMELRAQVEKALEAGVKITHFDSHKHVHVHPMILNAVISIAREFGIKCIRVPLDENRFYSGASAATDRAAKTRSIMVNLVARRAKGVLKRQGFTVTDHFFGTARTGDWDPVSMAAAIRRLQPGTTEFMVHPGRVDEELRALGTRLVDSRAAELEALLSDEVKDAVKETGARMISFEDLAS
jgi:chitin disaccharide deacetylase